MSNTSFEITLLTYDFREEHLMAYPHLLSKEKDKEMAKLAREKLSGEDQSHLLSKEKAKDMAKLAREKLSGDDQSKTGKTFVNNYMILVSLISVREFS